MAYKTKFDGTTDKTINVGGNNATTGKANPTLIEGYFLGSKDTKSDYGPGKLHIFQTQEGTVGVWGKTRMNNLLTKELVGQMVLLTFTGMVAPSKKGRKPSYGYKVQHDEENIIDTSGINLSAAEPANEEEGEYGDTVSADSYQEESIEEEVLDEVAPVRPVAPKVAARAPSAEGLEKARALLRRPVTR